MTADLCVAQSVEPLMASRGNKPDIRDRPERDSGGTRQDHRPGVARSGIQGQALADPHATLKEAGVAARDGVTVKVVEDSDSHVHLVRPPKPTGELSDGDLDKWRLGSGG